MKINFSRLVTGLINFNVNLAVASFAVGLFQRDNVGYYAGICFLVAFFLLCIKEKGSNV